MLVETTGNWLQGSLDVFIAMTPKSGAIPPVGSKAPQCFPGCLQAVGLSQTWAS